MSYTPGNPDEQPHAFGPDAPNQPIEGGSQNPPPPPLFNDNPPPPQSEQSTVTPGLPPGPPPASETPNYNYGAPPPPNTGAPTKEERNWAMGAHLSALAVGLIGMATSLPAFGFIGPLVIYLVKKDESGFIADQAKEALNFNITVGIAMLIMWVLAFLLVWTIVVPFLMMFAMLVVGVVALVFIIIAAVKAADGERYRYPINWRFIK